MTATDLDGFRGARRRDDRRTLTRRGFGTADSRDAGPWYGDAVPRAVSARLPRRHPGLAIAVSAVALVAIVCL